jgi:hypothetical protein
MDLGKPVIETWKLKFDFEKNGVMEIIIMLYQPLDSTI